MRSTRKLICCAISNGMIPPVHVDDLEFKGSELLCMKGAAGTKYRRPLNRGSKKKKVLDNDKDMAVWQENGLFEYQDSSHFSKPESERQQIQAAIQRSTQSSAAPPEPVQVGSGVRPQSSTRVATPSKSERPRGAPTYDPSRGSPTKKSSAHTKAAETIDDSDSSSDSMLKSLIKPSGIRPLKETQRTEGEVELAQFYQTRRKEIYSELWLNLQLSFPWLSKAGCFSKKNCFGDHPHEISCDDLEQLDVESLMPRLLCSDDDFQSIFACNSVFDRKIQQSSVALCAFELLAKNSYSRAKASSNQSQLLFLLQKAQSAFKNLRAAIEKQDREAFFSADGEIALLSFFFDAYRTDSSEWEANARAARGVLSDRLLETGIGPLSTYAIYSCTNLLALTSFLLREKIQNLNRDKMSDEEVSDLALRALMEEDSLTYLPPWAREFLWEEIRKLSSFLLHDLREAGRSKKTIRGY